MAKPNYENIDVYHAAMWLGTLVITVHVPLGIAASNNTFGKRPIYIQSMASGGSGGFSQ